MVASFVEVSLTIDLTPANLPNLSVEDLAIAQLRQDLITNKVTVAVDFVNKLRAKTNVADATNPEDDPAYKASIKIISDVTEYDTTMTSAMDYLTSIKENANAIGLINGDTNNDGGTVSHTFNEGVSLDISNGIKSNSMITLFQNRNENIEMYFTIGVNGGATIQYIQNKNVVWQNTLYGYTISAHKISFTLQPNAENVELGPEHSPKTVMLTVTNPIIKAHDTVTINEDTYTVLQAFNEGSVLDLIDKLK